MNLLAAAALVARLGSGEPANVGSESAIRPPQSGEVDLHSSAALSNMSIKFSDSTRAESRNAGVEIFERPCPLPDTSSAQGVVRGVGDRKSGAAYTELEAVVKFRPDTSSHLFRDSLGNFLLTPDSVALNYRDRSATAIGISADGRSVTVTDGDGSLFKLVNDMRSSGNVPQTVYLAFQLGEQPTGNPPASGASAGAPPLMIRAAESLGRIPFVTERNFFGFSPVSTADLELARTVNR